jgi:predicted nucleotidyltransferase
MITKDNILTAIRKHRSDLSRFGVRSVGLFGSYVRNEQTEKSDIDLLIDFDPEKENFDNYMALCDFLDLLFRNEKVEVVTKNGLSPHIGPAILREVQYV